MRKRRIEKENMKRKDPQIEYQKKVLREEWVGRKNNNK